MRTTQVQRAAFGRLASLGPVIRWKILSVFVTSIALVSGPTGDLRGAEPMRPANDLIGKEKIIETIRRVVIPQVEFVETPLEDAIEFLRQKASELDPSRKMIRIAFHESAIPLKNKKIGLLLNNAPIEAALSYTTNAGGVDYIVQQDSILIVAKDKVAELLAAANQDAGASALAVAKLPDLIVPDIEFIETPLEDALAFLQQKSAAADPDRTGVKIVLDLSATSQRKEAISLNFRFASLNKALRYTTSQAGLAFVLRGDTVIVASEKKARQLNASITKSYSLSRTDFEIARELTGKDEAFDILKKSGIKFPEGGNAIYVPGRDTLVVRNTGDHMELVEAWIRTLTQSDKVESKTAK